jgi:hypothetical protein
MNVQYFLSVISFHLLASSLMKTSCHINGSSITMMHAKSTSFDGTFIILEDLLVATFGGGNNLLVYYCK